MADEQAKQQGTLSGTPQPDPFEGVPPGCSPPRPSWPLVLAVLGYIVWVALLLILMVIRLRTSVV